MLLFIYTSRDMFFKVTQKRKKYIASTHQLEKFTSKQIQLFQYVSNMAGDSV